MRVVGRVEDHKHASNLDAAKAELAEECNLCTDEWIALLDAHSEGILEVKWGAQRFFPYIAMSPRVCDVIVPPDEEELIEVVQGVTVEQAEELAYS